MPRDVKMSVTTAAAMLGISKSTFYRALKKVLNVKRIVGAGKMIDAPTLKRVAEVARTSPGNPQMSDPKTAKSLAMKSHRPKSKANRKANVKATWKAKRQQQAEAIRAIVRGEAVNESETPQ
jgi:transposase